MESDQTRRKRALEALNSMLHPIGGAHRNYRGAFDEIRRLEKMPMTKPQTIALALLRRDVEPHVDVPDVKAPVHWTEFSDAWISETGDLILPSGK